MNKSLLSILLMILSLITNAQEINSNNNVNEANKKTVVPLKANMIAVLPVAFVNTQTSETSGSMSKFAQNDVYQELISQLSNIYPLTVQDIRVTNNLLKKAGINYENIDEIPIEDLQDVLGVDNLMFIQVQYTTKMKQSSSSYGSAKVDNKNLSVSESSSKEENTEYYYKIYFDIYKNASKIYTKSREPYLNLKDSWIGALHYLLKRSVIYSKQK